MILTDREIRRTAESIAAAQQSSGLIPYFDGGHADPWDHVEAAIALDAAGLRSEARAAYRWSAATQAADGSWPLELTWDGRVVDANADANRGAYLAVGVWHDWLRHGDRSFVRALWPTVRGAIDFACELQRPDGAVAWARDTTGAAADEALLTGSACLVLSLRCAMALAEVVGDPRPDWELAAARLAHTVAVHPEAFADRSRFSMDWYYPVLAGALRDPARARAHVDARWDEFVVPGRGARCVSDRPWVTVAETCELALALHVLGDDTAAARLVRDIQFCRTDDGGYWTGWVFPEEVFWPQETSTWTAAAVLLADRPPAVFRGAGLPALLDTGCDRHCAARV